MSLEYTKRNSGQTAQFRLTNNILYRKLKEEKQANIDASGGVLKVKVEVSKLYTGVFMVRNLNASQAIIHISNGEYVKLEPV